MKIPNRDIVPAKLATFFEKNPTVALAFSGGTDSAFLLWAATACGIRIKAYTVHSAFTPRFEMRDARRLADQLGAEMDVIEQDVLGNETIAANPPDRCYHCKRTLFEALTARARADGFPVLIDGTNASDDASDRPGMRALQELLIRSPLRECGITKDSVRVLSREAELFTWNKPAYACLATRIPSGTPLTAVLLDAVERSEDALFALGFSDFRVRYFEGAARIQFPADQLMKAVERREALLAALSPHWRAVFLDLAARD